MKQLFFILAFLCYSCNTQDYEFPEDFIFGVATASYQIEGAWNESDKGENIWDYLTHHNPSFVVGEANGDVACDSYNKIEDDLQMIKDIGVNFYRFSLSWSRLLPTGYIHKVSDDGVQYYRNLIAGLLAQNVTPFVTIFHWDLPQPLLELGGWPNPALADLYADYANFVFERFGDDVKNWITFNEPYQICEQGFSDGTLAPGYAQEGIGGYLCAHTVLRAHAKAYHNYDQNYRNADATNVGRIGIVAHGAWGEPETDSDADAEAAENFVQMNFGWFMHPIFSETGDYPQSMRDAINTSSFAEGFLRSRLPTFTDEEITSLIGSADFLGLNHYGASLCRPFGEDYEVIVPSHMNDIGADCYLADEWESTASPWFKVTPWGFRKILNWIKDEYNNPPVIVTENGYTDATGELWDCGRVRYYNSYLQSLLEAIHEDECNVIGYTAWSIMDNFEWQYGYTAKFGLYSVDFEDPDRPRTPKMSSYVYKNIIETRKIDSSFSTEDFETCGAAALFSDNLTKLVIGLLTSLYIYVRNSS